MRKVLLAAVVATLAVGAPLSAAHAGKGNSSAPGQQKDKDKDKDKGGGPPVILPSSSHDGIELATDNLDCNLLSGCVFNGNDNDHAGPEIEEAYNEDHVEGPGPAVLKLGDFIGKFDGLNSQTFGWDLADMPSWDGTAARFVLVKSSTQFKLFQLTGPATSGAVSGFIASGDGVKDISHVSFYGGLAIPEPATWALMIVGFGGAGAMLRRRRYAPA